MAALLHGLIPPLQNHEEGRQPNGQEKTPQWDGLGHKGDIANQGRGADQVSTKVLTTMSRPIPVPSPSP